MNRLFLVLGAFFGMAATGCLTEDECAADGSDCSPDEVVASNESVLSLPNALNLNALSLNGLTLNGLTLNALALNTSIVNTIPLLQSSGSDGVLARQFVRYAVGCALDASQSIMISWQDALGEVHTETYEGILGLATSWTKKPLSTAQEGWVSACMISRVNWHGTSVLISARGFVSQLRRTDAGEQTDYSLLEGAFWGNIFSSNPSAYACHYGPNVEQSRAKMRDCAAGHVSAEGAVQECGIIHIVGTCESHCPPVTVDNYYPSCSAGTPSDARDAVITVWLHQ